MVGTGQVVSGSSVAEFGRLRKPKAFNGGSGTGVVRNAAFRPGKSRVRKVSPASVSNAQLKGTFSTGLFRTVQVRFAAVLCGGQWP